MFINYDAEKFKKVLSDFSQATKININFVDIDLNHTALGKQSHNKYCSAIQKTPEGAKCCLRSDVELLMKCKESGKPEMHICHAGLADIAVPIFHNDMHLGYIILGQMKIKPDFTDAGQAISHLALDEEEMQKYYEELSLYRDEAISGVMGIAIMLAKYVLLENMLKTSFDKNIENAISFIEANLKEPLSVQYISKHTGISKTTLYKIFADNFSCTVKDYVSKKRIERSVTLLLQTDMTVEEISEAVGFRSAAYYSKTFKEQKKFSPLKFKKLYSASRRSQ